MNTDGHGACTIPTLSQTAHTHHEQLRGAIGRLTDKEIEHFAEFYPAQTLQLGRKLVALGKRLQNALD
jgi:hypothetical protein